MYISTTNIMEMLKDVEILLLLSSRNSSMSFRLAYLHWILTHSIRQVQGHAHFDCRYVGNGERYGSHCYCHPTGSHDIWIGMLTFELDPFKM